MKLIELLKICLINYLTLENSQLTDKRYSKQNRFFKGIEKNNILDQLSKMPIPETHKYGLFAKGDDGLKRTRFLLDKLNEWQEKKLTDDVVLHHICHLYAETKNPPHGLGNSRQLRLYLCRALTGALGIKHGQITDEEIKKKYDQLHNSFTSEDISFEYVPPRELVIEKIMYEKTHRAILKVVNDTKCRQVFIQGVHARHGENSPLENFYNYKLFSNDVIPIIFEFAAMNKFKFGN